MRRQCCALLLVVGWIGSAAPAFAQSGLGSITGTILDETGGRLAATEIRIVETSTGATRTTTSNGVGLFNLPAVPPGTYTITLTHQNFKTRQLDNIALNSFQQLSLGEVSLEVSVTPTDVIEVTAPRAQLDVDSGVRTETIGAQQVQNMPLQGRNWATLLKVVPGSNPTNRNAISGQEYSASGYGDYRINGKNPQQTQVSLDGGSLVDHGSDAKTTTSPSLESIEQVSVLTNNFQAEYGNRGGTVINIVTKSGTNQLRGALFDYVRNEALNAKAWADNFLGNPTPIYRYNYLGGNVGGPIRRNSLFFFYNIEDFKQDIPGSTLQGRVPTALERTGDFSQTVNADGTRPVIYLPGTQFSGTPVLLPGNVMPAALISPLGKAIMNMFPLPNNPGDPNNNYTLQYQRSNPRYSNVAKVDWNVNDATHAYVRYSDDEGTQIDRSISNTSGILPGAAVSRPRPDRSLAINATHTFSPTLVLDSLFAWSYDKVQWLPADPEGLSTSALGLSGLPAVFPVSDDILPAMTFGTYPAIAFNRMPAFARAHELQGSATLTYARGTHIIKGGVQQIYNLKHEVDQSTNKGSYNFSTSPSAFDMGYAPANILSGALSSFSQIAQVNYKRSIYQDTHAFLQDTWKVNRALTLDYGMRFYHIPTEHNRNTDATLDAVFLPSRWDPAKAPRFYIPDPKNPSLIIDPAHPDAPLSSNLANTLRYTIVPGSGDPLNGVVQLGKDGVGNSGIRDPRWLLLAPRGGFAWTMDQRQRTVLRGGFGWAYNRNNIADTINRYENGLGGTANLAQTSFATMAATSTVQPIAARGFGARDETNNNVPTVYDYSVAVQRQLFGDLVVDVAYVGNSQRHQPVNFDLNAVLPGTAFDPQYIAANNAGFNFAGPITAANPGPLPGSRAMDPVVMRPYRGLGALIMTSNIANVRYDALQVNVSKRLSHRLAVDASYTLGRTQGQIDTISVNGQTVNLGLYNDNWPAYTGYTLNNDRRHVGNISYIYELPKVAEALHVDHAIARAVLDDWKFAHLLTIFSGANYSPSFSVQQANSTSTLSATNLSLVLLGTPDLTPRLVPLGDPNKASGDLGHQFDPSQLAVPGIFPANDGTGPRNFLNGRGSFANDISLTKQFPLHGSQRLELRANIYNVFNNVRWLTVNSAITYKANGAAYTDGFRVFNTPELNVARAQANGVTDATQLFNQFRAGAGHVTLVDAAGDVQPPRIIEIGVALRF
jgi:hypothetical protein